MVNQPNKTEGLSIFTEKMKSFGKTVLPLNMIILAFQTSHPKLALSAELRPKLLETLMILSELKEITLDDAEWDTHPTSSLPRSIHLMDETTSKIQTGHC